MIALQDMQRVQNILQGQAVSVDVNISNSNYSHGEIVRNREKSRLIVVGSRSR